VIRVNLLPQKRAVRVGAPAAPSQKWLIAALSAVVIEIVLLFWFHQTKVAELEDQQRKNAALKSSIDEINTLVKNHEAIKKELAVLRAREDAIAKLLNARSGPTSVLLELAQLLTPGKGPTVDAERLAQLRKDNPLAVYNPGWDSRRLWLSNYVEEDRVVRLEGYARDGADVSELANRLRLSSYFYDVTLLPGKKQTEAQTKMEVVAFALQLKVRY
jgi:type IV pilus assembly protein PilN